MLEMPCTTLTRQYPCNANVLASNLHNLGYGLNSGEESRAESFLNLANLLEWLFDVESLTPFLVWMCRFVKAYDGEDVQEKRVRVLSSDVAEALSEFISKSGNIIIEERNDEHIEIPESEEFGEEDRRIRKSISELEDEAEILQRYLNTLNHQNSILE